ncbi:MAG: 23S rRNA (pseudouridine(1915)-N(3))-methyltransferase RlmH [Acidobacteria bacterium]|nr:23S rRNA (pseudouridine(1915)-N(3))-methyltransferase RlmH [Acidobacteriota bacterium]
MRLHFVWIGKTKDRRCAGLTGDFMERIGRFTSVELSELREPGGEDADQIIRREGERLTAAVEKDDVVVVLDENGAAMTSGELAKFIGRQQQSGIKRLAFVIGGYAGTDESFRERAHLLLSLSRFTLTHELARVVLTEQIYRAFAILAGHPYHKD